MTASISFVENSKIPKCFAPAIEEIEAGGSGGGIRLNIADTLEINLGGGSPDAVVLRLHYNQTHFWTDSDFRCELGENREGAYSIVQPCDGINSALIYLPKANYSILIQQVQDDSLIAQPGLAFQPGPKKLP